MYRQQQKGFNLIESAVVLGIIGLVIGGIWLAADSVIQSQRINNTAAGIIQLTNGARRLFSISDYPSSYGTTTYVISTAVAAGILPADFKYSAGAGQSPMGGRVTMGLACWSTCPMLAIYVYGSASSGGMTRAECIQLIRRFAGLSRDRSDLIMVNVIANGTTATTFSVPINPQTVDCPSSTTTSFEFYFRP
jgi:prepilin-type N-terminal cleavage/methylation domain-containing protein